MSQSGFGFECQSDPFNSLSPQQPWTDHGQTMEVSVRCMEVSVRCMEVSVRSVDRGGSEIHSILAIVPFWLSAGQFRGSCICIYIYSIP